MEAHDVAIEPWATTRFSVGPGETVIIEAVNDERQRGYKGCVPSFFLDEDPDILLIWCNDTTDFEYVLGGIRYDFIGREIAESQFPET